MNALQLVEKLREVEYKMTHLKMVIDSISNDQEFNESNEVLTNILKDYRTQYERTKETLSHVELNMRD